MTAGAAFLLAAGSNVDWWLLLATLLGTGLIIASGCVFNNYIDRGIDAKMARTSKRALVSGNIPVANAIIYGTVLGLLGFIILAIYTNWITVGLGAIGLFFYVVVYGYAKRKSVHGTLVGTIPGATPTVAGYCAVTNSLDAGAVILFLIMVTWQMAHFYSIAMYRFKDYKAAGVPVLPVVKGMAATKFQIVAYTLGFISATSALFAYGYTGFVYLFVMLGIGTAWLLKGIRDFENNDDVLWGRKMFLFSLIVLLLFSLTISLNVVLP